MFYLEKKNSHFNNNKYSKEVKNKAAHTYLFMMAIELACVKLLLFVSILSQSMLVYSSPISLESNGEAVDQYAQLSKNLDKCEIPSIFVGNADFYDAVNETPRLKEMFEFWKILYNQMILRYGKNEMSKALHGKRSKIKFDELDNTYFTMHSFFTCLLSK